MSLKVVCPNCGTRPIEEFAYGEIPVVPDSITDADEWDVDRGFMLNNPEGIQREAWFHEYGCRRWTYLYRDTVTDQFIEEPT